MVYETYEIEVIPARENPATSTMLIGAAAAAVVLGGAAWFFMRRRASGDETDEDVSDYVEAPSAVSSVGGISEADAIAAVKSYAAGKGQDLANLKFQARRKEQGVQVLATRSSDGKKFRFNVRPDGTVVWLAETRGA